MKTVFIATPMSAFTKKEYAELRALLTPVVKNSKNEVFAEIVSIEQDKFMTPTDATLRDIDAVLKADLFIMIHPAAKQTSTLFELGIAFAHNKEILILFKDYEDLPFMLKELDMVSENVRLCKYIDAKGISKTFREELVF